jgi:hypothetical protein
VTEEKLEVLPNYEKQARYARAHERLKLALEYGFFIEAAMICESIITDRLHSHLHWHVEVARHCTMEDIVARLSQHRMFRKKAPDISLHKPSSLFILIMAVNLDFDDYNNESYQDLPQRLDRWREGRNKIAHSITYTRPTHKTYAEVFDEFMSLSEACAREGKALTGHLSNWDRLARRRHEKAVKTGGD